MLELNTRVDPRIFEGINTYQRGHVIALSHSTYRTPEGYPIPMAAVFTDKAVSLQVWQYARREDPAWTKRRARAIIARTERRLDTPLDQDEWAYVRTALGIPKKQVISLRLEDQAPLIEEMGELRKYLQGGMHDYQIVADAVMNSIDSDRVPRTIRASTVLKRIVHRELSDACPIEMILQMRPGERSIEDSTLGRLHWSETVCAIQDRYRLHPEDRLRHILRERYANALCIPEAEQL